MTLANCGQSGGCLVSESCVVCLLIAGLKNTSQPITPTHPSLLRSLAALMFVHGVARPSTQLKKS